MGGEGRSISFPVSSAPFPESSPGSFKHHHSSGSTTREAGNVALRGPASGLSGRDQLLIR